MNTHLPAPIVASPSMTVEYSGHPRFRIHPGPDGWHAPRPAARGHLRLLTLGMILLVMQSGAGRAETAVGQAPRPVWHGEGSPSAFNLNPVQDAAAADRVVADGHHPLSLGHSLRRALQAAVNTGIKPDNTSRFMNLAHDQGPLSQEWDPELQASRRDQAKTLLDKPVAAARQVLRDDAKLFLKEKISSLPLVESLGQSLEGFGIGLLPFSDEAFTETTLEKNSLVKVGWNPLKPTWLRLRLQQNNPENASGSGLRDISLTAHLSPQESHLEGVWKNGDFHLTGVLKTGQVDGETTQLRAGYRFAEHAVVEAQGSNLGTALMVNYSRSF
ncbi:MAG: hypothetical protein H7833_17130 [Magnetococcus sp. DMHC-1]|nr:hypothetical protein [Magnetococcales bacterium]